MRRESDESAMNSEHISILKRGSAAIEEWRRNNAVDAILDVRGAQFEGLELRGADLSGADFSFAQLVGCDLNDAVLDHANFTRAHLRETGVSGASFLAANLQGVVFERISAYFAFFEYCRLANARVHGWFNGSTFSGVRARGVEIRGYLTDTSFDHSDLSQAKLLFCEFEDADFESADLSCAQVYLCDFDSVAWASADLRETVFADCSFGEADLSVPRTERATFIGAPPSFDPPDIDRKWSEVQVRRKKLSVEQGQTFLRNTGFYEDYLIHLQVHHDRRLLKQSLIICCRSGGLDDLRGLRAELRERGLFVEFDEIDGRDDERRILLREFACVMLVVDDVDASWWRTDLTMLLTTGRGAQRFLLLLPDTKDSSISDEFNSYDRLTICEGEVEASNRRKVIDWCVPEDG